MTDLDLTTPASDRIASAIASLDRLAARLNDPAANLDHYRANLSAQVAQARRHLTLATAVLDIDAMLVDHDLIRLRHDLKRAITAGRLQPEELYPVTDLPFPHRYALLQRQAARDKAAAIPLPDLPTSNRHSSNLETHPTPLPHDK